MKEVVVGFIHHRFLDNRRLHITGTYTYPHPYDWEDHIGDFFIDRIEDMDALEVLDLEALSDEDLECCENKADHIANAA